MEDCRVIHYDVDADGLHNSEQSKRLSASENGVVISPSEENGNNLVDDDVGIQVTEYLQGLRENDHIAAMAIVTTDTSRDNNVSDSCPTVEENSTQNDRSMAPGEQTRVTDTGNVNIELDNKEQAVQQYGPLKTSRDTNMTDTSDGKLPGNWRKLMFSETEIPAGFEAVLMELGDPGKFFWIQFVIHLLATFCLTNTVLVYVFTGYEPPHICNKLENESAFLNQNGLYNISGYEVEYRKCDITVLSNNSGVRETVASFRCVAGHDYHGNKHISFVSEWDMVCDNVGLKELVQIILMVGQTFGALIFTSIADKYGRKPVMVACNLLLGGAGFGVAYAPNIYVMIAFRFLCGFFQQGTGLVGHTILMEFLTAKNRRVVAILSGLYWTITVVLFGVMSYLMRDQSWRMIQVASALFACNVILSPYFLYESPRWLSANKRYTQTLAFIKKACQTNKRDYEKVKAVFEHHVVQPQEAKELETPGARGSKVERYSLLDIVRHRSLFVSALILWFVWITNSTTYYGLFLTSSSLAGNRHLNFILMGFSDLPADIINLFLFAFFGRKPLIMGWLVIAGSGLLTATMLMAFGTTQITSTLSVVFSCVGKLGIGASFNSLFMYTPELFPTNLRSAGFGVCSSVSRLGGMISPYSQALADVVLWGPGSIFSAMCFLSAILFSKMPETRGQPMPNTIADMKQRVARHYGNKNANVHHYEVELLEPKELNINN
ncbi:hypothetical protein BsWGS_01082 [Bradybaena similaris]